MKWNQLTTGFEKTDWMTSLKTRSLYSSEKAKITRAQELLSLAGLNGYEPTQRQKVEPMTLMALYRERVEAGLDMPSDSFNLFIQDETKISRKK